MNTLKKAILEALRGNVFIDNQEIPVLGRYYPSDQTPCITMDDSSGATTEEQYIVNLFLPVGEEHPQYDPENPDQLFPQECLEYLKNTTIKINVWCDTEKQREEITSQIIRLFRQAEADHYQFCTRYDLGFCQTTGEECQAVNGTDKRGVKNQCPSPDELGYENIFSKHDLLRSSFSVKEPYSLDDLTAKQPVLRNIIPVDCAFKEYYTVGGSVIERVTAEERLI